MDSNETMIYSKQDFKIRGLGIEKTQTLYMKTEISNGESSRFKERDDTKLESNVINLQLGPPFQDQLETLGTQKTMELDGALEAYVD